MFQFMGQIVEGEAHDIGIVTLDFGDDDGTEILDAEGAGFVQWFAGGDVIGDFAVGEVFDEDTGYDGPGSGFVRWGFDDGQSGNYLQGLTADFTEHQGGLVGGVWFAEYFVAQSDEGVGGDNQVVGVEVGDGFGLAGREVFGQFSRWHWQGHVLLVLAGHRLEGEFEFRHQLFAAGRGGSQDDGFHRGEKEGKLISRQINIFLSIRQQRGLFLTSQLEKDR